MPEQTNDKITFYNSSNIPLPALTEKAVTQELQEEFGTRLATIRAIADKLDELNRVEETKEQS